MLRHTRAPRRSRSASTRTRTRPSACCACASAAPPAAISMHRATPVKWELDVTDDQGTTVPAVDVEVRCRVDGAPHPVTTTRVKERWLCSAPAAAFTDRCRVVAEPWVAGRRAGPLDVLGVAAEVRVVAPAKLATTRRPSRRSGT